jgi:MFS-type transporter involved in bile tolerance (Atg22 family)
MAATDQIRQMVNFILQEAHEKANEIRVKVSWLFVTGIWTVVAVPIGCVTPRDAR